MPLAALTGVQVGAALVASGAIVGTTGSALLALLRYALAVMLLVPFALSAFRDGSPIAAADRLPIALLGIGQFGALIWLLNLAVERAAPSRVALVFATLPAITALVLWSLGRGRPTARTCLGIGGSVAGIAVLLGRTAFTETTGQGEPLGLVLALAATTIAALCSALYRPYLVRYGVGRVGVLAMLASIIPLAILAAFETAVPVASWPPVVWALVAFVGALSAVGYAMWLGALARLDAATVTAFLALSPVTAAILSAAFDGTRLAATDLAALVLVAGALCLTASERSRSAPEIRP